uniref:Uncharacterized protein n=1 Tax=Arundo donax TaxID=35708 RepID=A0A0A9GV29_ARUDO
MAGGGHGAPPRTTTATELKTNRSIQHAMAVWAGYYVHRATLDGCAAEECWPAPTEVHVREGQTQPAYDPQVGLRHDQPLRYAQPGRIVAHHLFHVVHQRLYVLVAQAGSSVGDLAGGGAKWAGDDVLHLGHRHCTDDGVAEVAVWERRADAGGPHVPRMEKPGENATAMLSPAVLNCNFSSLICIILVQSDV